MAKAKAMPVDSDGDRDFQAESDFHTLTRAQEVLADRGRHSRAIAHGRMKQAAIQKALNHTGLRRK